MDITSVLCFLRCTNGFGQCYARLPEDMVIRRTTLRSHKVIQYLKVFCKMQSAEFSIGDIKSIDEDLTGYQSCYYLLYISSFLSEEVQDTDITEG